MKRRYEYSVQWRRKGEDAWVSIIEHYPTKKRARFEKVWVEHIYGAEARVVRRTIVE